MSPRLFAALQSGGAVPRLSALTPLDEMVAALNAFQPGVLLGYPTVATLLAIRATGRPAHHRAAHAGLGLGAADRRDARPHPRGVGHRSRRVVRHHRGLHDRLEHARASARAGDLRGPVRDRGRRRPQPARAARDRRRQGAGDQPREPHAAADPLRARRSRHRVARAQSRRTAVPPPGRHRRPHGGHADLPRRGRRDGRRAPAADGRAVRAPARRPPVPDRARARADRGPRGARPGSARRHAGPGPRGGRRRAGGGRRGAAADRRDARGRARARARSGGQAEARSSRAPPGSRQSSRSRCSVGRVVVGMDASALLGALPVGLQLWDAAGDDPARLVLLWSNQRRGSTTSASRTRAPR